MGIKNALDSFCGSLQTISSKANIAIHVVSCLHTCELKINKHYIRMILYLQEKKFNYLCVKILLTSLIIIRGKLMFIK